MFDDVDSKKTSWWAVSASEIGTSHSERNKPCQDSHSVRHAGSFLILVVSDGAGSASRSHEGSQGATTAAVAQLATLLNEAHPKDAEQWRKLLDAAITAARKCLEKKARDLKASPVKPTPRTKTPPVVRKSPRNPLKWLLGKINRKKVTPEKIKKEVTDPFEKSATQKLDGCVSSEPQKPALRDFACTLLVAVIGPKHLAWAHIGDGWGVCRNLDGQWETFSFPERGEFVNTTYFLTGSRWREKVRYGIRSSEDLDGVVLMTDGMEQCAMELQQQRPFQGFFKPFASWLEDPALSETKRQAELCSYLQSEPVNERTDDDKTIILASRGKQT